LGTISLIPSRMAHNSQSHKIYQNILYTLSLNDAKPTCIG